MGIGILIVVAGSLIYKGRGMMQKILNKFKDKKYKKDNDEPL